MNKKPPAYSLYLLFPWSLALFGILVVLGNLLGLAEVGLPVIPRVENLPGLLTSSVLLFCLGLLHPVLAPLFRPRD